MKPLNFAYLFKDPDDFFIKGIGRKVIGNTELSINNMTDHELRQAILEDILVVTMYEIQSKKPIHFGFTTLFRFLSNCDQKNRCIAQMVHYEIIGLIDIINGEQRELRIGKNLTILQTTLNYCGYSCAWSKVSDGNISFNYRKYEPKQMERIGY